MQGAVRWAARAADAKVSISFFLGLDQQASSRNCFLVRAAAAAARVVLSPCSRASSMAQAGQTNRT